MQTVNLPFHVTGPDLSDDGVNKMKRAKKSYRLKVDINAAGFFKMTQRGWQ